MHPRLCSAGADEQIHCPRILKVTKACPFLVLSSNITVFSFLTPKPHMTSGKKTSTASQWSCSDTHHPPSSFHPSFRHQWTQTRSPSGASQHTVLGKTLLEAPELANPLKNLVPPPLLRPSLKYPGFSPPQAFMFCHKRPHTKGWPRLTV